tara:strand:+ start:80346 stop:80573 length:228 start_codon:yes stop_codon:yes gene_type:complete
MGKDFKLYKQRWIKGHGYVVYRDLFKKSIDVDEGAIAHKEAIFVDGVAAQVYCNFRNSMTKKYGTDAIELIVDFN